MAMGWPWLTTTRGRSPRLVIWAASSAWMARNGLLLGDQGLDVLGAGRHQRPEGLGRGRRQPWWDRQHAGIK
jgi:hypothetical protein